MHKNNINSEDVVSIKITTGTFRKGRNKSERSLGGGVSKNELRRTEGGRGVKYDGKWANVLFEWYHDGGDGRLQTLLKTKRCSSQDRE